jgi:hypothetical protein
MVILQKYPKVINFKIIHVLNKLSILNIVTYEYNGKNKSNEDLGNQYQKLLNINIFLLCENPRLNLFFHHFDLQIN